MLPSALRGRGWAEHANGGEPFHGYHPLAGLLMSLSLQAACPQGSGGWVPTILQAWLSPYAALGNETS